MMQCETYVLLFGRLDQLSHLSLNSLHMCIFFVALARSVQLKRSGDLGDTILQVKEVERDGDMIVKIFAYIDCYSEI